MGMAAPQARFMELTERSHCIGRQLQHYALEKDSLVAQAHEVSKKYNESLKGKVLKWSNNGGINYVDLTYGTLMRPSAANGNSPLLITTSAGRVILDEKYKKYAERFAPEGKSGSDWMNYEGRAEILSELTGIPASKIENSKVLSADAQAKKEAAEAAREKADKAKAKATTSAIPSAFAKNWGDNFKTSTGTISLGGSAYAESTLKAVIDGIANNMKSFLPQADYDKFKKACDAAYNDTVTYITGYATNMKSLVNNGGYIISGNENDFKLDKEKLISSILAHYDSNAETDKNGNKLYSYVKGGIESDDWKNYLALEEEYKTAQAAYDAASGASAVELTAEEESQIQFYDKLFTAVAENGWQEDGMVTNAEYLNQMFQNNEFYITQMKESEGRYDYDANGDLVQDKNEYDYNTDLWSNSKNIFAVNDEAARQEALTEYEYEKSLINLKEKRIDQRMTNLQTEQDAIKQMMKGLEQQIKNGIESTFNIFT